MTGTLSRVRIVLVAKKARNNFSFTIIESELLTVIKYVSNDKYSANSVW